MNYRTPVDELYADDPMVANVIKAKYLDKGETSIAEVWERVAYAIASIEDDPQQYIGKFYDMMHGYKFIPGGRILHGAGRSGDGRKPTLSNCYVVPITEDSLEGIYQFVYESALVYRSGGGVGTDLSILRPKGSPVNASVDESPGCTAFMDLFSQSTDTVSQAGRRGALMLTLDVSHPDIEDFIAIKDDPDKSNVNHANISVKVSDAFMHAVVNDKTFDLQWGETVYRTVNARDLWDKIIAHAHASAEPGIIFWDTMKKGHRAEASAPLLSTNPCGEQPLPAYTACNLGSFNLNVLCAEAQKQLDDRERIILHIMAQIRDMMPIVVRFMDDVIDYNHERHALDIIRGKVSRDRRIGIGFTGMADMFIRLGVEYGSKESISIMHDIMYSMQYNAYHASVDLAIERGPFPDFDISIYNTNGLPDDLQEDIRTHGIRNATLLTLPPVGSGSIIAQTSFGIEPIFMTEYTRDVRMGDDVKQFAVAHKVLGELFPNGGPYPDYVVTAHEIDPLKRVEIQAAVQQYIDASISSTINMPSTATIEDVRNIYMEGWKRALKGVTVYRDGVRKGVINKIDHDQKTHPTPRDRPTVTHGITRRVKTGDGKLYVTINEDDQGVCEVFSTIGKSGGAAAAQSEAISRLISLVLRSGVDPMEIVKELEGIAGPKPLWDDGKLILSTPDAIGQTLRAYLEEKGAKMGPAHAHITPGEKCPECGGALSMVEGCMACTHCGWSKCGGA